MNLSINDKGQFRILHVTDIQERADFSPLTRAAMEYLLDTQKPDLVMLGGDNCFGPDMRTREDVSVFLEKLAAPMEERGIKWAHIFGNHDHDVCCVLPYELQAMYEAFPHCVSRHSQGIHGITNYYLDVTDENNHILFRIWCMDTNGSLADSALNERFGPGGLQENMILPKMPGGNNRFDMLYFDQLAWYDAESRKLELQEKRKVPGIMFCHVAPEEFTLAMENPEQCGLVGSAVERLAPAAMNSGLFSLLVQRGDVHVVACGHTHMNSFSAHYCGIQMCFSACTGYTCYGRQDIRGGRIFDFDRGNGSFTTDMVVTTDVIPME
ncbi:MAG: metallophosphoesterase [Christensenellales bacterium]|jgi:hypothetical protein